jgi:hypothetical protein
MAGDIPLTYPKGDPSIRYNSDIYHVKERGAWNEPVFSRVTKARHYGCQNQ